MTTKHPSVLFATLLAVLALLLAGACGKARLAGKRVDVEGFGSAQRTKAASSQITLPRTAPPAADWTQEQFSPLHVVPHGETLFRGRKIFRVASGKGRSRSQPLQAAPVIAEGRLHTLSTAGEIKAFDIATGRKEWQHKLKLRYRKTFGGGLAVAQGRLFVSTGAGVLAALEAQTGALLWQERLPLPLRSAPTLSLVRADDKKSKGLLLVATPNQHTYAFNTDGKLLWQRQTTRETAAQLTLTPSLGLNGRYAVAGYGDGSLVAMDANNGRVLWQTFATAHRRNDGLADLADITTPPVLAAGLVYASSFSGKTVALDLASGALRWQTPLAAASVLALYNTTLFVVDQSNTLSALDSANGKVLWERQLTTRKGRTKRKSVLWNGPLLAAGQLILSASNGEIITVDATNGDIVRQQRFAAHFTAAPITAQGRFFFMDAKGNIHVFE